MCQAIKAAVELGSSGKLIERMRRCDQRQLAGARQAQFSVRDDARLQVCARAGLSDGPFRPADDEVLDVEQWPMHGTVRIELVDLHFKPAEIGDRNLKRRIRIFPCAGPKLNLAA